MTGNDEEYQLGPEIVRRRKRLRLSQTDLASATGLNVATIRRLEKEPTGSMRGSTANSLESVLRWRPGLVDKLMDRTATPEELDEVFEGGVTATVEHPVVVLRNVRSEPISLHRPPPESDNVKVQPGDEIEITGRIAYTHGEFWVIDHLDTQRHWPRSGWELVTERRPAGGTGAAGAYTHHVRYATDTIRTTDTAVAIPTSRGEGTIGGAPQNQEVPQDPAQWRGPLQQQSVARAAHDVGQALVGNLVFCERTPRVNEAISLVQRALNLLLAEQALPGGDV